MVLHNKIVDMWTRGELRTEVGESGEAVDVASEFGDEITGVMGNDVDHECTWEEERSLNSTPTEFDVLLERSSLVMSEDRHITLQSELAQHLWNRRGESAQDPPARRFFLSLPRRPRIFLVPLDRPPRKREIIEN